ncbi:MAG TPA: glycosyltransferase [Actinocrinis sp.]|nr:glycosyltransferase [Actinocrinis sp.]
MSIVVPAHNEARVIGRLLAGLTGPDAPAGLDILVVANGCSDETAAVAAAYGPSVRVLETPKPSKYNAMRLADAATDVFPRIYVDADVEFTAADARALAAHLSEDGPILAAAPERRMPTAGLSWTIRWYYDVWPKLPAVRAGLFGRGVIGVSAKGFARLSALPELMGDDLAASLSFSADERLIAADSFATVHPPRTCGDLVRRRVRAVTVTVQAGRREELAQAGAESRTTKADLLAVLRSSPVALAPKVAWFLAVTLYARRRADKAVKAGDFTTWLRDESSRAAAEPAGPPGA